MKDRFDIAFACDTDHDRHGIVTATAGLIAPNHYLAVMHRLPLSATGRTGRRRPASARPSCSTSLIDRVAKRLGRSLFEVPVGFKWFAEGLLDGSLGFGGEESAGASFLRRDGSVWTTDKDGIVPALLSAEITARTGQDPGRRYDVLADALGRPFSRSRRGAGHGRAEEGNSPH